MEKKIQFVIISILLIFTIIVIGFSKENDSISDFPEEDQVLNEDLPLFENDVIIEAIKTFGKEAYAFGEKNEYPYLMLVNNGSEITIDRNTKGKIIDIDYKKHYLTVKIESNGIIEERDLFISKDEMIPFYKKQLTINYSKGVTIKPEYLVIHETANTKAGADAHAHYRYWSTNSSAKASTHFVVDSTQIYQMLELNQMAWHVGDNKGYSPIVNSNTIGIEIAVNSDGNYEIARQHTIELTIKVMRQLNMNINQLVRHYDASGKLDPITMLENPTLWDDFVNQVKEGLKN